MKKVILIGYFIETVELCKKCGCKIIGIVDEEPKGNYRYLGNDEEFVKNCADYIDIPLVITPDKPEIREKIYNDYKNLGFSFKTLIAPEAVVSESATISEGCIIQTFCNISSNVKLDKCVRVNTGANIMHDCNVGAYSVVAPSAVLLGKVVVGEKVYIGANSTLLPSVSIGDNSKVGAGAVVTRDVNEGCVVVGIPARMQKSNHENGNIRYE